MVEEIVDTLRTRCCIDQIMDFKNNSVRALFTLDKERDGWAMHTHQREDAGVQSRCKGIDGIATHRDHLPTLHACARLAN